MSRESTWARWRDLPGLVWTHAAAYGGASVDFFRGLGEEIRTDEVPRNVRVLRWLAAVAMVPLSFLLLATAHLRGGVHGARDRRSLVIAVRHSRARALGALLLVVTTIVLVVCTAFILVVVLAITTRSGELLTAVMWIGNVLFWALVVSVVAGGALQVVPALLSSSATTSIGDETPDGDRWVIESLAARTAADGAAAFLLAARTLRAFPTGRVLAAGARTDALRDGYERLGFTAGEENRVYLKT